MIRDKIAAHVIGTLAPAMALVVFSNLIAITFLSPDQWTREIPTYIVGGLLILDWILVRAGRVRLAADLFVLVVGTAMIVGMILNGGIDAPIFAAGLSIMAIVAWLYGKKGAIVYVAAWAVSVGTILYAQLHGMLPEIAPISPGLYVFFMATYLLMTFVATVVPADMLHVSLKESEKRRALAEEAHSEAKQATEHLRERERALIENTELLQAVVADIPGVVYRTGNEDRWNLTFVSDAVLALTGHPSEKFIGKGARSFSSIIHAEDLSRVSTTITTAIAKKEPFAVEYRIVHSSQEERRVFEKGRAVLGDKGEVRYLTGFVMDISKEIRREEMLRQAQKMQAVGQLAGGIAHDFNNMLACIMGFAEMALDDLPPDSPTAHSQKQILAATRRSKHLVEQILTFSRRGPTEKSLSSLDTLLKESISIFKGSLPTSVKVVTDFQPVSHATHVDATQFHEVFINVATNAVHAMNEKGTIRVTLKEATMKAPHPGLLESIAPGRYAVISVSDSGIGMGESTLKKIFDPFFTTKPPGRGTGMGLSVVWGVMQEHGGNITVESEPGIGTTVCLYFPLLESLPPSHESYPIIGNSRSAHILFVDDEPMLVDMMQSRLSSFGYDVTAVTAAAQALALLQNTEKSFDLIIADQTMPEMTGIELINEARRLYPNLPAILCTGYSSAVDEASALDMGISKYLAKPIQKKELQAAVQEVLACNTGKLN